MSTKPIVQLIEKPVSGEWGVEPSNGRSIGVIRNANFTNEGVMDLSDIAYRDIPERKIKQKALRHGDIIIEKSGGSPTQPVGRVIYYDRPDGEFMFSNFTAALRPVAGVDSRFVYYMLWATHLFKKTSAYQNKTTGIANLQLERYINEVEIPCPPLPTQRRIAAVLDKAQALVANDRRTLAVYDQLVDALYAERFGLKMAGPTVQLYNAKPVVPKGWRWVLFTDVAKLGTGHTPSRRNPEYWNGDIPWLTTGDIRERDGRFTYDTPEMVTEEGIRHSSAVVLPAGTVCFSRTASVGFITIMGRPMATSQDFVNWTCGEDLAPIYLMHSLMWSREHIRAMASGSTHKTIYFPAVEQFAIVLPTVKEQGAFAKQLPKI